MPDRTPFHYGTGKVLYSARIEKRPAAGTGKLSEKNLELMDRIGSAIAVVDDSVGAATLHTCLLTIGNSKLGAIVQQVPVASTALSIRA